ncbi:MAG: hypothetical protein ABSD71_10760 [Bacteroidales bacterium]|jgi:hypothetical protein
MSRPKLKVIDLNVHRGLTGNIVIISAWDKYRVETVRIMVLNEMDQIIESSQAVVRQFSVGKNWDYKAIEVNPSYMIGRIIAHVTDLQGNVVQVDVDVGGK